MDLSFLHKYSNKIFYTINYKYNECFICSIDYRYQISVDVGGYGDKASILVFKTNDNGISEIVNIKTLPNNDIDNLQYIIENMINAKQYQMLINNFYKNCKENEMTNTIMNRLYYISHLSFEDCCVQIYHYEDSYLQVSLYNKGYENCLQIDLDDDIIGYHLYKNNKFIKFGDNRNLKLFIDDYYTIFPELR